MKFESFKPANEPIAPESVGSQEEGVKTWEEIEEADRKMMAAQLGLSQSASQKEIADAFRIKKAVEMGLPEDADWREIESKSHEAKLEEMKKERRAA